MKTCDFSKARSLTEARRIGDEQLANAGTPVCKILFMATAAHQCIFINTFIHFLQSTIRAFLLQNIVARHEFQWRVNIDAILNHLRSSNTFLENPQEDICYDKDTLFLCGSESNYVA